MPCLETIKNEASERTKYVLFFELCNFPDIVKCQGFCIMTMMPGLQRYLVNFQDNSPVNNAVKPLPDNKF